ncbi:MULTISPECIES: DNA-binding protein [Mycobacteriaceae]|uniref:DNA-binding protein n=1 Tax=Mycobacteriaceae TaxID=1762 RepID=UPI001CDA3C6A|nr:DNA-binding protein [Mycobacterium sp. WUMAC-067]MCA2243345.1 helix-turn-helix domain-containing protein [Mycobacterium sp. WUMAC-067]
MDWEKLGVVVRDRRAELGLTQTDVNELGGPSVLTLRAIENNRAGRLSPRLRRSLERALKWESGSIEAVLEGGVPKEIQQPSAPSPPPSPGGDRFALARRVLSMKETFGKHRDQMEQTAREALSEEITRSAREAEEGIITLMPWLDEAERGEAISLLAELRAEV